MREANRLHERSRARFRYRAKYANYMGSAAWFRRRERWVREYAQKFGADSPIVCAGCGREWCLDDDLHHCSYRRLGAERFEDLWPMCRSCHDGIHQIMDSSRSFKKLSFEQRSVTALQRLRALTVK